MRFCEHYCQTVGDILSTQINIWLYILDEVIKSFQLVQEADVQDEVRVNMLNADDTLGTV